jgi:hypothetical protein
MKLRDDYCLINSAHTSALGSRMKVETCVSKMEQRSESESEIIQRAAKGTLTPSQLSQGTLMWILSKHTKQLALAHSEVEISRRGGARDALPCGACLREARFRRAFQTT